MNLFPSRTHTKALTQEIANSVYEDQERIDSRKELRGYLGMSSIGQPCDLAIWYSWRHTSGSLPGRVLMIFEFGHLVEQILAGALRKSFHLENAYPEEQLTFSDFNGLFKGHPDGVIEFSQGSKGILEIKSANQNKFNQLKKDGVLEVYPAYYVQMQLYMWYSGLSKALLLVFCKNDSSIYEEVIDFDEDYANFYRRRAARLLQTHDDTGRIYMPARASEDVKAEVCQWCRYKVACFEPEEHIQTIKTCRSCSYLNIGADFQPSCNYHKRSLKNINLVCGCWQWVCRVPVPVELWERAEEEFWSKDSNS